MRFCFHCRRKTKLTKEENGELFSHDLTRVEGAKMQGLSSGTRSVHNQTHLHWFWHDQAIFSVLCNLYPIHKISSCEVVYPKIKGRGGDWKKLKIFPIHARRDRRENFSTKVKGIRNDVYSFFSNITNLRS